MKIKELYYSRNYFLKEIINPLIESGDIYRDVKPKSPNLLIKIKRGTDLA